MRRKAVVGLPLTPDYEAALELSGTGSWGAPHVGDGGRGDRLCGAHEAGYCVGSAEPAQVGAGEERFGTDHRQGKSSFFVFVACTSCATTAGLGAPATPGHIWYTVY